MKKYREEDEFGELINSICLGYDRILKQCDEKKNSSPKKKRIIPINYLKLENINRNEILDYQDEFLSKVNEFS